ncbi:hypothetical protein EDB84DRAFT_1526298 [Lactarius hengduanensis]|nr:hypothetical protein EDB84DRAFT_1526298 [Lactarius hengduanensis]
MAGMTLLAITLVQLAGRASASNMDLGRSLDKLRLLVLRASSSVPESLYKYQVMNENNILLHDDHLLSFSHLFSQLACALVATDVSTASTSSNFALHYRSALPMADFSGVH